jgi:hypothetical protein
VKWGRIMNAGRPAQKGGSTRISPLKRAREDVSAPFTGLIRVDPPFRAGLLLAFLLLTTPALAQKKPEPKDKPQLALAIPFVIPAGKPAKVVVRGLKLDGVTEVRCHEPKSSAKLLGKPAKANVPDAKLIPQLGDMQIEIEVVIPTETSATDISISLIGPGGESNLLRLRVDDGQPVVAEKEPNNGFKQAQPLSLPATVDGAIQSAQDVDVFRIDGKAGKRLVCEILAGRYGSPLDPILTLFDDRGQVLSVSDETDRANNVRLTLALPRDGAYYLSIADANDQGGAFYRYRLVCRE